MDDDMDMENDDMEMEMEEEEESSPVVEEEKVEPGSRPVSASTASSRPTSSTTRYTIHENEVEGRYIAFVAKRNDDHNWMGIYVNLYDIMVIMMLIRPASATSSPSSRPGSSSTRPPSATSSNSHL